MMLLYRDKKSCRLSFIAFFIAPLPFMVQNDNVHVLKLAANDGNP
jgi:hypothetical protein